MKSHKDVIPSRYGANELKLTNLYDIFESFYKFFVKTYAGKNDQSILKKWMSKITILATWEG